MHVWETAKLVATVRTCWGKISTTVIHINAPYPRLKKKIYNISIKRGNHWMFSVWILGQSSELKNTLLVEDSSVQFCIVMLTLVQHASFSSEIRCKKAPMPNKDTDIPNAEKISISLRRILSAKSNVMMLDTNNAIPTKIVARNSSMNFDWGSDILNISGVNINTILIAVNWKKYINAMAIKKGFHTPFSKKSFGFQVLLFALLLSAATLMSVSSAVTFQWGPRSILKTLCAWSKCRIWKKVIEY